MASLFQSLDLESGPQSTTNICDTAQMSGGQIASSPAQSAESSTAVPSTSDVQSQLHQEGGADGISFAEDRGQAVLLAFNKGRGEGEAAILVPVSRPSTDWAREMAILEKAGEQLPVSSPKKEDWDVERWRQFRWLHHGENEVDIWERIRRHYDAQRPRWQSFLPSWRPVLLEERKILLHSQEGDIFRVEIEPALDVEEEQRKADRLFDQAREELGNYMPDEYCCVGDFDAFGDWFTKYHDSPHCQKGIPIDDYSEHPCDFEIYNERQSKRDRMKRRHDFIDCFKDPSKAKTVFPLTTGRVLGSSIHDQGSILNCKLPDEYYPSRLPPRLNGLVIEYRFSGTQIEVDIFASSLFMSGVVLMWKLATGDCNVAAAFGGLCAALMTLAHQRRQRPAGTNTKPTKAD